MGQSRVAHVFAEEWPPIVATLVRELGDLALAEDCAQDAFLEAAARWGPDSTPDSPGAWLLTTARRKAIDLARREKRFSDRLPLLHAALEAEAPEDDPIVDDQLALIFGCCHPSLSTEARVALTLREVCGLSTGQIAAAFLTPEPTMAKRLVRAKGKIRSAGVPFSIPDPDQLGDRLAGVLAVIYVIFTEGHTSADAASLVRGDLCDEARWLAGLLATLLPDEPEVRGLLALLCFTDARRPAREDADGDLVLLEDQDRRLWDRPLIAEGDRQLTSALQAGRVGPYQVQAAIAGEHSTAAAAEDTDWAAIVALYDTLIAMQPSAVVRLNRAIALGQRDGPLHGLDALDDLSGQLSDYRYFHAARADLLRQLRRVQESRTAYERALELGGNRAERDFIRRRIAQLDPVTGS